MDRPPRRQREALVLRYRLDLSERENVIMGIARGRRQGHLRLPRRRQTVAVTASP
ncbi:hypothetical protein AB0M50_26695 [Nonomuraea fuscirosea]|uniref:hypothetical protein n=1 Tax=Nonomuraea fuscirosea TaxID=1291556 RepID=UPI0034191841